jgi:hypothetical protein
MAHWDDVRRIALALPETTEGTSRDGRPNWDVKGKTFAWERPLRKADLLALGESAPTGPILGARTGGVEEKEAFLCENPAAYFTTPHFDGYPAVLVRLDEISDDELRELLTDAWLAQAPKRLSKAYLDGLG